MRIYEIDKKSRRKNDKDITGYTEVPVKKTEPEGDIDSVIAHIKGARSAFFTKIARRFERASRIKKMLAAEEKSLKKETLQAVDAIFDAGDNVYTRVVETAALVFKIAKSGEKTVDELDNAGYLEELEQLTGLAVKELELIKNKYISQVTKKIPVKVLAPKEKKPAKESVHEGVMDSITQYISLAAKKIQAFLGKWDVRFNSLKANIESII